MMDQSIRIKHVSAPPFLRVRYVSNPQISFAYCHLSMTPYSADNFTFANVSNMPIMWKEGSRVAYLKKDFPNGIVFGMKQGEASVFGDACKDLFADYSIDNYLRCRTRATLYDNIDFVLLAFSPSAVKDASLARIDTGEAFHAFQFGASFFPLDASFDKNEWIKEADLASKGWRIV